MRNLLPDPTENDGENPTLRVPDLSKQFIIFADCSGEALGYILAQPIEGRKLRIAAYGSNKQTPTKKFIQPRNSNCAGIL